MPSTFNIRWLLLPLFLLIGAVLADEAKKTLSVTPTTLSVQAGKQVTAKVSNASGSIKVSTANEKIATAKMDNGLLKISGKAVGSTKITVKDKKKSVQVTVQVTAASGNPPPTPGTGLTVSPGNLLLIPSQTGVFNLSNAVGSVSITSPNTNIASASLSDNTIQVKAKAVGNTLMTVRDSRQSIVLQITVQAATTPPGGGATLSGYTLLAWNDLGMHCMDGDYSVFAILPPYNNLRAQLVNNTSTQVVTQGVSLSYEAMADPDGSINSSSGNKSNFWQYAKALFGVEPAPETGLTGNMTASTVPQPMGFNATDKMFLAEGIPITPYDDAGKFNPYPLVKVVARDTTGKVLAQARVVLPVSDEMSCASCHASGSPADAMPKAGWVNQLDPERDFKMNVLRLHDDKQLGKAAYASALLAKGYSPSGLLATVNQGKPILCATCHASNALPGTGVAGLKPLTEVIHGHHAKVKDAKTGVLLDSITNRSACYQCHPGSETKCLRGAMGDAVDANGKATMDCQACHGTMSNVGRAGRVGWLDQPNCQACHHDGKRELAAVSATGILKKWVDTRYASNPNTPAAGFSLFRMSKGHGGLQCEACHGATHAEYPSSHRNDNLLSLDVQGRPGTISECTACHKSVPTTATGGPHGMHTVGSAWVSKHEDYAKKDATACAYCHGADYRGGVLSTVKTARSFNADGKTVNYTAGQKVGCYDCHNGPRGD